MVSEIAAALATRVVVAVPHVARLDGLALAAFLAVGVCLAALTLRRPAFGAAALLLAGPFDVSRALGPTTVTLPKAVLVGVLVGLALRRVDPAPLRARVVRPLLAGAVALVAVDACSFIPAEYADAVARETLKATEYLALFVAATLAVAADPDEGLLWNALGLVTVAVCALALVQDFTIAPSGLFLHGRIVPRIAGPLEGPNQLAGWLNVATPLLAARALLAPRPAVFAALATLAVTVDLLTLSRGGVLGLAVGLAVVGALAVRAGAGRRLRRAWPLALVPAVALGALLTFALPGGGALLDVADRSAVDNVENGLGTRPQLWGAALRLWARDPGLGVGAGNYELLTPTVGLVGVRTHANSLYLQSLAEGGVALLGAVLWTTVAATTLGLRGGPRPLLAGIAAATLALAAHQVVDDLTFYPKIGALWWTLLGAAAGLATLEQRRLAG